MRFCLVGIVVVAALWAGATVAAEPDLSSIPASEESLEPDTAQGSVATAVTTAPTNVVATPTSVKLAAGWVVATSTATVKAAAAATPTSIKSDAIVATSTATAQRISTANFTLKDEPPPEYNYVMLQGLNKVTGHVSKLEGPVGTVMNFGGLEIIVRRCWKAAPEEQPENAALMEIRELKAEEGYKNIFLGWMFSSSPGLSGLEHPVYDVTLLSCESLEDPEKGEKPTVATATAKPPAATGTARKSAATATAKKPAATGTAKKRAATATAKKPVATATAEKIVLGTPPKMLSIATPATQKIDPTVLY